jgi:uncharacterized protein YdeI (BOF family)
MRNFLASCAAIIVIVVPAFAQNITSVADAERGTMVTLRGTVDRILDEDEFRLRDGSGAIKIETGSTWVDVTVGEAVTVEGFVDDDIIGPREVYARSLPREDGTVVTFSRNYD